jgi:hypothetical protein
MQGSGVSRCFRTTVLLLSYAMHAMHRLPGLGCAIVAHLADADLGVVVATDRVYVNILT